MVAIVPERLQIVKIRRLLPANTLVDVQKNKLILLRIIASEDALLAFQTTAHPHADE